MVLKLKNIETTSETLKEARVNVKKMSLAKDILIFLALYLIIIFSPLIPQLILGDIIESESPISQIIGLLTHIPQILVIILIVLKLEKRSLRSIGISKDNVIPSLLKGLSIGFLMFLAIVIIGFVLGQFRYNGFELSSAIYVIPFLFAFGIQSFAEEFHLRGWAMTYLSKRHSILFALIVTSIIFSANHLLNPGIDVLSLINIFLVGILFALMFWKYDNIWICGATHTAWNFSQGIIFGFSVSGTSTSSILKCSQVGQNLINGGKFGPESSLIATFVLIIALILIIYLPKK